VPKFRVLYLAPIFALIALMAWVLASPIGSSPDDDFHLASIWCANASDTAACLPGSSADERIVPAEIAHPDCYAYRPTLSASCENQYLNQGSKPTVATKRGSFDHEYPPVYYATMSVLVGSNIAVSVVLMRLLNIVLLVGITTALFLLLPVARRPVLVWGWLLTMVPLGLFLVASNNPSSWAIIGIGSAWLALLGYFETSGRRRIGLGIVFGAAALMAAGSRSDSALYLIMSVGIVGILTFARTRAYLLGAILPVVACVVAVYFYLGAAQSSVTSTGLAGPAGSTSHISTISLIFFNLVNVPQLWAGAFGTWDLGWLDTAVPAIVPFVGIVAFLGLAFLGLRLGWRRKWIALILLGLALWLIPTYVLVKGSNIVGQNVQPRYLLPLIIIFAGLMLLREGEDRIVLSRIQYIPLIVGVSVAESLSLYFDMRRYITGTHGSGFDLDASKQWWWNTAVPPMAVWAVGTLAFAALVFVLVREVSKPHAVK
jgi:hypothetical protein